MKQIIKIFILFIYKNENKYSYYTSTCFLKLKNKAIIFIIIIIPLFNSIDFIF